MKNDIFSILLNVINRFSRKTKISVEKIDPRSGSLEASNYEAELY